jgi:hypothetical protein
MNLINKNFDAATNLAVQQLTSRTPIGAPPRVNRKNGASSLDKHFNFILMRVTERKSLNQILMALEAVHEIKVHKSSLSRFINKKIPYEQKQA